MLFICSPVCRQKTWFSQKLSNLALWSLLRTHYWTPKIQEGWVPRSWKSTWRHFLSAENGPIWIKFRRLVHNDMSTAVVWSKLKPDVECQYGGRLSEFNGMWSHSHLLHCRVQPLGEFTVTIPEPHATLQSAVTWWNQCHDRATLQGVRIPSAILKLVFRHILFLFVF